MVSGCNRFSDDLAILKNIEKILVAGKKEQKSHLILPVSTWETGQSITGYDFPEIIEGF